MKTGNKQSLVQVGIITITLIISLSILAFILFKERDVLLTYNWQIEYIYMFYSFVIYSVGLFCASLIWSNVMNEMGSNLSAREHIQIYIVSNVIKRLPGTVWYVASRGFLYKQYNESAKLVTSATAVELLVSIAGGLLLVGFWADLISESTTIQTGLLITGILILIFLNPKILGWLFNRAKIGKEIKIKFRSLVLWIFSYSVIWVLGGSIIFMIAKAMYQNILIENWSYVIGSWTLVGILSTVMFFFPSNLGVTELGLTLLLSQIMPASLAVILSIMSRIALILFELIWAMVITIWFKNTNQHFPSS